MAAPSVMIFIPVFSPFFSDIPQFPALTLFSQNNDYIVQ